MGSFTEKFLQHHHPGQGEKDNFRFRQKETEDKRKASTLPFLLCIQTYIVKHPKKDNLNKGHHSMKGTWFCPILIPQNKGHLKTLRCPLFRGFTVQRLTHSNTLTSVEGSESLSSDDSSSYSEPPCCENVIWTACRRNDTSETISAALLHLRTCPNRGFPSSLTM